MKQKVDWGHVVRKPDEIERHLSILRDVLSRDYLAGTDWEEALHDLAATVRRVARAQEAMVALYRGGEWSAVTSSGARVSESGIAEHGSRTALEEVRTKLVPLLETGDDELTIDSDSIMAQQIVGFIVVPLFFWDVAASRPDRTFGGCIYAHRTFDSEPFNELDVDVVEDIARIAQPVLNLLRSLSNVQADLQASRRELQELRRQEVRRHRLGDDGPTLPWAVWEPLSRIKDNDKVSLLILGPTGSGKSHLARAYHYACPRRDKPFVVLDCGSVTSAETLGAELFGYAPNSGYANAPARGMVGKARLAHGGTLFIDEVGNLSLTLQPRLLRLIQDGRFSPLGASEEQVVDIQILAATNADLSQRVEEGTFREDLYHRLNVVRVALPTLDERPDEIPALARELLRRISEEAGKDVRELTDEAVGELLAHTWARRGNIRGIENLLRRSVWAAPRGLEELGPAHLRWIQDDAAAPATEARPKARGRDENLQAITRAIREHRSATDAARALGMTYRQLYWRLQKAGLSVRDVLSGRI